MNDLKYFNAKEALHRIKETKEKKLEKELDFIYDNINKAIEQEKEYIDINFGTQEISDDAIKFLTERGYSVMRYNENQINGDVTYMLCVKFK